MPPDIDPPSLDCSPPTGFGLDGRCTTRNSGNREYYDRHDQPDGHAFQQIEEPHTRW